MTIYREFRTGGNQPNPLGGIGSVLMLVFGLLLVYLVVKGIFTLLFWLSPLLLIAGIAIDPKGALGLGKSFLKLSRQNPLVPIGIVLVSALWFPVVPGIIGALIGVFLLIRATVRKKIDRAINQNRPQAEEEFVEYEDITEDESFLELPEVHKQKESHKSGNEYDNLFE